jgi:hypothetical protein
MFRVLAIALLGIVTLGTVVGCSKSPDTTGGDKVVPQGRQPPAPTTRG